MQAGLLLICAFSTTVAPTVCAEAVPESFTVRYILKRHGLTLGENLRTLKAGDQGEYIYESITQTSGILRWFFKDRVVERSTWIFHGNRIRPLTYLYERSGGEKERHVTVSFDWEARRVTNTVGGDAWRMTIPSDAQDKLVYQLSLMRDLQHGRNPLRYHVADGGKLKRYEFDVLGSETIKTSIGKLDTLKIRRIDAKRDTTVWCAISLNYLPVRLEQNEKDGPELSMHIKTVKGIPSS